MVSIVSSLLMVGILFVGCYGRQGFRALAASLYESDKSLVGGNLGFVFRDPSLPRSHTEVAIGSLSDRRLQQDNGPGKTKGLDLEGAAAGSRTINDIYRELERMIEELAPPSDAQPNHQGGILATTVRPQLRQQLLQQASNQMNSLESSDSGIGGGHYPTQSYSAPSSNINPAPQLRTQPQASFSPQAARELEQWLPDQAPIDTGHLLGPAKSRKSNGFLGMVWPSSGLSSAAVDTPTPIYPTRSAARKAAADLQQSAASKPSEMDVLRSLLEGEASAVSRNATVGGPTSSRRHNLGSEEIALHTPLHTRSHTDYEWKRYENSRAWNNLRGMWGKRSIS